MRLRHKLRARLAWLGLGTVAAGGVDRARARPRRRCGALIDELGLADHVELFRGDHLGGPEAVAAWWDLDAIAAEYRALRRRLGAALRRRRPPAGAARSPPTSASSTPGGGSRSTTRGCPPRCCRPTGRARTRGTFSARSTAASAPAALRHVEARTARASARDERIAGWRT